METIDPYLSARLQELVPTGVLAGARRIHEDDEKYLSSEEADVLKYCAPKVRRASGAARGLARELLSSSGMKCTDIGRGTHGEPIWSDGVIGSLTHDKQFAAAAVAIGVDWLGLGIDVEPNGSLTEELADYITTHKELQEARRQGVTLRQVFSIKEAVFKAVFPSDRVMLDFHDIEISFRDSTARTAYGRVVKWNSYLGDCVFAVAWF